MVAVKQPLKLPDGKLPGGVEAWLLLMTDGTAKIVGTDGHVWGTAEIEQPATAKTCDTAMQHVLKQIARDSGVPKVGDFVTRVDRTTGEFWLNERFGPFTFEVNQ